MIRRVSLRSGYATVRWILAITSERKCGQSEMTAAASLSLYRAVNGVDDTAAICQCQHSDLDEGTLCRSKNKKPINWGANDQINETFSLDDHRRGDRRCVSSHRIWAGS